MGVYNFFFAGFARLCGNTMHAVTVLSSQLLSTSNFYLSIQKMKSFYDLSPAWR